MSKPGVADSEAGEEKSNWMWIKEYELFKIDRSLLEGKEDQKSCQEEQMRKR